MLGITVRLCCIFGTNFTHFTHFLPSSALCICLPSTFRHAGTLERQRHQSTKAFQVPAVTRKWAVLISLIGPPPDVIDLEVKKDMNIKSDKDCMKHVCQQYPNRFGTALAPSTITGWKTRYHNIMAAEKEKQEDKDSATEFVMHSFQHSTITNSPRVSLPALFCVVAVLFFLQEGGPLGYIAAKIVTFSKIRNSFSRTLKNPKSVLRSEPALLKIRNRNPYRHFSWLYYTDLT